MLANVVLYRNSGVLCYAQGFCVIVCTEIHKQTCMYIEYYYKVKMNTANIKVHAEILKRNNQCKNYKDLN